MTKSHSIHYIISKCLNCCDILVSVGDLIFLKLNQSITQIWGNGCFTKIVREWNEKTNVYSKGKQYLLFKDNLNFEKYLINVSKLYYSKIIKYRTGDHRLPVETGRWDDTPLNERKCKICTTDDVGDE